MSERYYDKSNGTHTMVVEEEEGEGYFYGNIFRDNSFIGTRNTFTIFCLNSVRFQGNFSV